MKNNKGFTLLETTLLLLLLGLLLVPALSVLELTRKREQIRDASENPGVVRAALEKYALRTGRYPRPAERNIASGAAGFGLETANTGAAIANCGANSAVVCRVVGQRDQQNTFAWDAGNDPVLIGDVPFAELGLPEIFIRDGYNRKLTYAVSEYLTDAATFVDEDGVIKLVDIGGVDHDDFDDDNLHYVIVSHGQDGRGAFTFNGVLYQACGAVGTGRDVENCDMDSIFTDNADSYDVMTATFGVDTLYGRIQSKSPGASHYDDYVDFVISVTGDIWTRSSGSEDVRNRNGDDGSIRMGADLLEPNNFIDDPANLVNNPIEDTKIHVMGDLQATVQLDVANICVNWNSGLGQARNCDAPVAPDPLFMPAYPDNTFTPAILGGVGAGAPNVANAGDPGGGILCNDRPLTGIAFSDEECNYSAYTGPAPTPCGPGLWPRGVDGSGQFICQAP